MRRIVYISTATMLSDDIVTMLVEDAKQRNAADGITGFLLYNGRNFMQLIEGAEDRIAHLMGRLEQDARHSGVVRIIDAPVTARCAPDWAMQQISMIAPPEQRLAALQQVLPVIDSAAATLVRNFVMLN